MQKCLKSVKQIVFCVSDLQGIRQEELKGIEFVFQGANDINGESWLEQGDYLPFNVSYQILAGAPSHQQSE